MKPSGLPAKSPNEAANRALAEAKQRRKVHPAIPIEHGGRKGLEPTRYGDWEKKGIVSDF